VSEHGVLLEIAYDGTAYAGWAPQVDTRTVHSAVTGAIHALDARASLPRGTSRTDAGVHADGQLAAFDATLAIPPRGWVLALNQHLPDDVCIRRARAVTAGFNPRFAARGKRYRYRVLLDRVRDPRWTNRAWRIGWPVDLDRLARAARHFEGTHDFAAFRSSHDPRSDTVRTMTRVAVEPGEDPRVVGLVVEGSAFLYNMVRIMVGTLFDVARGKLAEDAVLRALDGKTRSLAGTTAPAHGLTLEHIDLALPENAGDPWPR
jgi:tRNA pseudouridine38-40 synthase